MKRGLISVLFVLGVLVFCNYFATADATMERIWAGQNIDAGHALAYNTTTDLKIVLLPNPEWNIIESNVSVHIFASQIPQTKSGNPKTGKFEWGTKTVPPGYTYSIPLSSIDGGVSSGQELCIAVHVVLQNKHNCEYTETGWAGCGENMFDFGGNNWAVYFKYTLQ